MTATIITLPPMPGGPHLPSGRVGRGNRGARHKDARVVNLGAIRWSKPLVRPTSSPPARFCDLANLSPEHNLVSVLAYLRVTIEDAEKLIDRIKAERGGVPDGAA